MAGTDAQPDAATTSTSRRWPTASAKTTRPGCYYAIDEYYADLYEGEDRVATQVARQLADPRPRDEAVTHQLDRYRQLDARWHDWNVVVAVCRGIATRMLEVPS